MMTHIMGKIVHFSHENVGFSLKILCVTSKARVTELKLQLQYLKKRGISISDFVLRVKGLSDQLMAAGEPVSDKECHSVYFWKCSPKILILVLHL